MHRAQNVDEPQTLSGILQELRRVSGWLSVVLPLHPRARNVVERNRLQMHGLGLLDPLFYLDHACPGHNAQAILTNSRAVQKEGFIFRVPRMHPSAEPGRLDTAPAGWNTRVGCDSTKIAAVPFGPRPA